MFISYERNIEVRDIGRDNKVKNTAIISYLEETACRHSDVAGYGLFTTEKMGIAWVVLNWKINIFERPQYGDKIKIVTWVRKNDKLYSFRDFEIFDSSGKCIGIATSKWILISLDERKVVKITEEMSKKYEIENKNAYENFEFEKIKEFDDAEKITEYKVGRNMIDVNNHVHNVCYLDIANEALPIGVFRNSDFDGIEIFYKKEIKYNDNVKLFFKQTENECIIIIKSEDEKIIHSVIKYSIVS